MTPFAHRLVILGLLLGCCCSRIGRAAEASVAAPAVTLGDSGRLDESDSVQAQEAAYLQPARGIDLDPPVPQAAPRSSAWSGLSGLGTRRPGELAPSRAERASAPGSDVIFGFESALRLSSDTGSLLGKSTSSSGLGVQRRTPIVTDTRIRGRNVGQQLASGSLWFPARQDLDTPLSKLDSSLVQDVVVVKGPYSALYGPGFSFYDVELLGSPRYENGFEVHGSTGLDYQTNGQQFHGRQMLAGGAEDWGFRASYNHRTGEDYQTGNGTWMPASYNSRDAFIALGFDLTPDSHLEFSYLRLDQTGVEFPGQAFDMDYLKTDGFELRYVLEDQCVFERLTLDTWYNRTRFKGNSQRPSKRLQIPQLDDPLHFEGLTYADAISTGFRLATTWGTEGDPQLTSGVDLRRVAQELQEFDLSPSFYTSWEAHNFNFPIPRSQATNPGIFAQGRLPVTEQFKVAYGGRIDWISTSAARTVPNTDLRGDGQLTDLEWALGGKLDRDYTLWSAFITADYELTPNWTVVGGAGRAMRPPTLTELYAVQPFLAVLQQGFTKVLGNPNLSPERLWQVDLGLQADYGRFRGGVRAFHAWIQDYITFETYGNVPDLSEPVAFAVKYTNTELATLAGTEANAAYDLNCWLTSFGTLSYVEGRDQTRGVRGFFDIPPFYSFSPAEPLPGIAPLESRVGVRVHEAEENPRWALELAARIVAAQHRVAESLFEQATPGFTTFDIRSYWQATDSLLLIAGIENVGNVQYREHLDLRTGLGVYQPGRSFYCGTELRY